MFELEDARRRLSRLSAAVTEQRMVGKRACSRCNELKGPDGFYRRDRVGSWCKVCEDESRRSWRANNREREREYNRLRYRVRRERAG